MFSSLLAASTEYRGSVQCELGMLFSFDRERVPPLPSFVFLYVHATAPTTGDSCCKVEFLPIYLSLHFSFRVKVESL